MKDELSLRQCEENCRSVIDYYGLPRLQVLMNLTDRTIFYMIPEFLDALDFRTYFPGEDVFDPKKHKFERWPFNQNHGASAFAGWRERVDRYSMQVVAHETKLIEIDFDYFNPNHGVGIAIGHAVEICWNKISKRKTDPFKVMAGLRKRGITVPDARMRGSLDAGRRFYNPAE